MVKIGIVGSRNFSDYELLKVNIDHFVNRYETDEFVIVSGGAKGADSLAEKYASERHFNIIIHRADWNKHGRAAGMIRNGLIVSDSDVLVAFWNGSSKGTKNTIDRAKKKGIPVHVIDTFTRTLVGE